MRPAHRDTVISGLGALCAVAENQSEVWEAIAAGRDGIEPIRRFSVDGFRVRTGAVVKTWADRDTSGNSTAEALCRCFAERAAEEAMADARLAASGIPPGRLALVLGTGLGDLERPIHRLARQLAAHLGALGPCLTVSNACSSSTCALGLARDLLAMDAADAVIAGGADVLSPEVFSGFHALGVLSPGKCAPFSLPVGTTMGEGAGFVVVEKGDAAHARGARIRATLSGYGLSGDAFHETSPDPTGSGVERALRSALGDAGVPAEAIGYVNAHGSGTEANDSSEWRGIRRGLGLGERPVPISSTKGALGHAQGAAGVLEAIVTILAMERGVVPPTLHFVGPRPHAPPDPVGGPRPRVWSYDHALCLNSAFGGANAAVVLSRRHRHLDPIARRPVGVFGVGLVGPHGLGGEAVMGVPGNGTGGRGRVPPFEIATFIPSADPRGLDPASRYLAAAAALALADAGLVVRGSVRDRTGLCVGAVRPSAASTHEFRRSIEVRGLQGLSAPAFARIVLNAPAGFCTKLLALRGPLATLATGPASGLVAIAIAAELLSTRPEVDWMIAGAVDEHDEASDKTAPGWEGAATLLLGRVPEGHSTTSSATVRISGWGMAGEGGLAEAIARARADTSGAQSGTERTFTEEAWQACGAGDAEAAASARACAAAVLTLRRGEADRALVTSRADGATTVALMLAH